MKLLYLILFVALAVFMAQCSDDDDYYDYLASSCIDTVLAGDTIVNMQSVDIVHVYPTGCNYFSRFASTEAGDTLSLQALYDFYFHGNPCAHGSGLDTTAYHLVFSHYGQWFLKYARSEGVRIVQPIFVKPPNAYDYLDNSYIYKVLAPDTIHNGDPVQIVHIFPGGCNHFERFESDERGNTLSLNVVYHWVNVVGYECAHGSGLDTTAYSLAFSSGGVHFLKYTRSAEEKVVQPIYVED